MKKILLVIACFSVGIAVFAQDDSESGFKLPRTFLKISPLQFVANTLELGIEAFNPTYSKSFNFSFGFRSGSNDYYDGNGASVELAYRKYAAPMKYRVRGNRESYQGIYYSFFVRGEYFKGEDEDYYSGFPETYMQEIFSIAPGFTIGFQKTLWQIIMLDAYVGGGVKFSDVQYLTTSPPVDYEPYYGILDPGYSGIFPKIGVKIGIGL